ncbi:DUF1036 domain-containing protein [Labilithrix luteola]|uniref:DUF1036 domain-containing protein n=1 Tax=Labilithrix luteola TaxID=1391654 RepID=UPI0011BAB60A|nr:DUF1036 domain-containing protein [Labilithrix luteola]
MGKMIMKRIAAALTLATIALVSRNSFAWFDICNNKTNGASMYVTYASYVPNTTKVFSDACGSYDGVYSPAYFTAWRNTGWWHLEPNQCARVYGPALTNTWGYVYAQISDGSTLTGANIPFTVSNVAFSIDQYRAGPFNCGAGCVGVNGAGSCGQPAPNYWTVNALPVNQGSYTNFTFSIH